MVLVSDAVPPAALQAKKSVEKYNKHYFYNSLYHLDRSDQYFSNKRLLKTRLSQNLKPQTLGV
jgi:hypothetical protein